MDMDDFKLGVKLLIGYFIISQIVSYKMYGPYSLLCWNDVTENMFLAWPVLIVSFSVIVFVIIGVIGCALFIIWLCLCFVKNMIWPDKDVEGDEYKEP